MKSYIINLDRNPERMAAIGARFAAQGIAFERFAAVDARAMTAGEVDDFRRRRPALPWDHLGQIGCFLSHLAVWRLIAAGSDPCGAVFEDDIHISDDLAPLLARPAPAVEADILRLETSTNRVRLAPAEEYISARRLRGGRSIMRVRSTTWCAGGYILSREAAARLVALPERDHQPVDWLLFCFEASATARGLDIAQVIPAHCVQDRFCDADARRLGFASEIEVDAPPRRWPDLLAFLARNAVPVVRKTVMGYERVRFAQRVGEPARPGPAPRAKGAARFGAVAPDR